MPGSTSNGIPSASPVPAPASGAYPRSLLSTRARNSFVTNLRQAATEADADDEDVDPLLTSRHVGPLARKRAEQEEKERLEEEAREVRRAARRSRGSQASQKSKEATSANSGQPLMTFNPSSGAPQPVGTSPIVLSSSTGTRLRIKPPAPPPSDPNMSSNAYPSSSRQSHAQQGNTLPHPQVQTHTQSLPRSESPLSPPVSSYDEPSPGGSIHPASGHSRNGNGVGGSAGSAHSNSPIGTGVDGLGANSDSGCSPSMHPHSAAGSLTNLSSRSASDVQRLAKPKRLKAHTVTSKSFSIPTVPRDKVGKPMLPLNVGIMTVVSLGEVCMREHFHTERYIYPVGYEVTRLVHALLSPRQSLMQFSGAITPLWIQTQTLYTSVRS